MIQMLRRSFVLSALAARRRLRLGFSLYALPAMPVIEALQLCRRIGYDGVELCLQAGWTAEPKMLGAQARRMIREELRTQRLELLALMDNLSLVADDSLHRENLQRLEAAAALAHDLSPERHPLIETVLGGKPADWERVRHQMLSRVRDFASVAKRTRTEIAIKAHVGGAVNQPDRLVWLLERVASPWVKVVYDFSHFQLIGLGLDATLRELVPHVAFVHLKDSEGDASRFRFLLPGSGSIDYSKYFRLLVQLGYRGPVVPEVSLQLQRLPGYDGVVAAHTCYRNLANKLEW
jgi:inosose dehydratase